MSCATQPGTFGHAETHANMRRVWGVREDGGKAMRKVSTAAIVLVCEAILYFAEQERRAS